MPRHFPTGKRNSGNGHSDGCNYQEGDSISQPSQDILKHHNKGTRADTGLVQTQKTICHRIQSVIGVAVRRPVDTRKSHASNEERLKMKSPYRARVHNSAVPHDIHQLLVVHTPKHTSLPSPLACHRMLIKRHKKTLCNALLYHFKFVPISTQPRSPISSPVVTDYANHPVVEGETLSRNRP